MQIFLSIVAVLGGYLATAVLVVVSTIIASKALNPPQVPGEPPVATVPYLVANLSLALLGAMAGGYLCAWIAPVSPLIHVIVLACLFGGLALATAITSGPMPGQPSWYPWVIGIIGASGVMIGGILRVYWMSQPPS